MCFRRPINSRRSSFVEFNSKLRKQIGYIGKSAPFLPIRISFVWKQKSNRTRSTYEKELYGIEQETKKTNKLTRFRRYKDRSPSSSIPSFLSVSHFACTNSRIELTIYFKKDNEQKKYIVSYPFGKK